MSQVNNRLRWIYITAGATALFVLLNPFVVGVALAAGGNNGGGSGT